MRESVTVAAGWTALMVASSSSHSDVAQSLLKHEALDIIDARDIHGRTALYASCVNNKPSIVKLLLDEGADPTNADNDGRTPLDIARQCNSQESIRLVEVCSRDLGKSWSVYVVSPGRSSSSSSHHSFTGCFG